MAEQLWDGDIFAGKYRVEGTLGQGAMGMVIAARHLGLDEAVAIKVLLPAMREIPGMADRFLREARAAAKIRGEHVVRVADVDTLPNGVPFMVMERLDGVDLAELKLQRGRLGVEETVRFVRQACTALADAHAVGIVHRDIKPGNLFLAKRRDGSAGIKVLDFGISKLSQGDHNATTAGTVLGSPNYMSPEQMMSAKDVDGRTDIWALGVVLYELLTGTVPFPAETLPQLCTMVLHGTPRRPMELRPDIHPGLEQVVLRCLEKDSRNRPSASELSAALAPFSGESTSASFPGNVPMPNMNASASGMSGSVPGTVMAKSLASSMPGSSTQASAPRNAGLVIGLVGLGVLVAGGGIAAVVLRSGPTPGPQANAGAVTAEVSATAPPAAPPTAPPTVAPVASSADAPPETSAVAPVAPVSKPARPTGPVKPAGPAAPPKPGRPKDPFSGDRK